MAQSLTSNNITIESGTTVSNTFATTNTAYPSYTLTGIQGTIADTVQYIPFQWTDYTTNIDKYIEELINKNEKQQKEEKKNMNEFNFGPYSNSNIRLSPYGIALKNNAGKYVSYDRQKNRIIDVDILNVEIDPKKIFFKVPRPIKDIKPGDLIIHNDILMFVEEIDNSRITVIDPTEGTEKKVLPALSPFGYDYIPVIISIIDYLPAADENNPFGGLLLALAGGNTMLPLLLSQELDVSNIDPITLLALSSNNSSLLLMLQLMNKKKEEKPVVKEEKTSKPKPKQSRGKDLNTEYLF